MFYCSTSRWTRGRLSSDRNENMSFGIRVGRGASLRERERSYGPEPSYIFDDSPLLALSDEHQKSAFQVNTVFFELWSVVSS